MRDVHALVSRGYDYNELVHTYPLQMLYTLTALEHRSRGESLACESVSRRNSAHADNAGFSKYLDDLMT